LDKILSPIVVPAFSAVDALKLKPIEMLVGVYNNQPAILRKTSAIGRFVFTDGQWRLVDLVKKLSESSDET